MIYCHVMGGLGNQLFQIFTAISYAIQHNRPFCFPPGYKTPTRHTYWDSFLYTLEPFSNKEIDDCPMYKEIAYHYVPIPPPPQNANMKLGGYFQSPLYFEANWDSIVRMIRYKEIAAKVQEKYPEYLLYGTTNTVSLHFRLGDYKNLHDFHPILSKDYYIKAFHSLFTQRKDNYLVYYFCEKEDNETILPIIQELGALYPTFQFIKVADTVEDWEQMVLMSLCKHHIIANSTFSWWGAYFSRVFTKDSMTFYPSVWFGIALSYYNMNDLFPKEWIKIQ
jgi:Glycosyl transferase family 11